MLGLKKIFLICGLLLATFAVQAQQLLVKGIVTEAATGEPLASVAISDSSKRVITTTNQFGYFSLIVKKTPALLLFSTVGYEPQLIKLTKDSVLNVGLQLQTLQEVEVKERYQQGRNTDQITIVPTLLNNLPSVGGERDLIKAISTFAGVTAGSELSSSINVRGGANDQNLFYLDGAPIYNTGHLFSFLSLFNPDAIQRVNFYKGDFPAEFGGRLSSVTDVLFREGNKTRWEGKAELGVISSKLLIEGPLIPNKTSVLLAARSAYLDLFSLGKKQAVLNRSASNYFGYNFYDLNFKINHSFNANNKLFLSYYRGLDNYQVLQNSPLNINFDQNLRKLSNQLFSLRSYHALSSRFFLQTGLHFTQYAFRYNEGATQYNVELTRPNPFLEPEQTYTKIAEQNNISNGKIQDISANVLADWAVGAGTKIKFGAELIRHLYEPVSYQLQAFGKDSLRLKEPTTTALEGGVFASASVRLSSKWQLNAGGRYSYFQSERANYGGFEPRTSLSFQHANSRFQVSATRMIQYNHALVKGGELVDKTIWVPSTGRIVPQTAWQYSVGWSQAIPAQKWSYSLGAYYKKMQNLSMYRYNYGDTYLYYNWEANTLTGGQGRAYGVELMAEKNVKRWDFRLNYTLSWSRRQFEEINDGEWFNDLYDRRHAFNGSSVFKINKTTQLSLLWLYYTGQRYNTPVGRVLANPLVPEYVVYDQINEGKLPDYHRFDVSLSKKFFLSKGRFWELNFNIYNLYSRRNTYRLYPATDVIVDAQKRPIERRNVMKSASVFPILPSISIIYKFR